MTDSVVLYLACHFHLPHWISISVCWSVENHWSVLIPDQENYLGWAVMKTDSEGVIYNPCSLFFFPESVDSILYPFPLPTLANSDLHLRKVSATNVALY